MSTAILQVETLNKYIWMETPVTHLHADPTQVFLCACDSDRFLG